jgi:YbbR domain-containing protein
MDTINKTPVIIASTLFAIVLWITVNLGFDYTTTVHIPIVVQNISDEVALKTLPPESVRVRLRGEGWKLLGMKIAGETRYMLDLQDKVNAVTVQTSADLGDRIRIPSGIAITELQPERFTLELENKAERTVPVEPVLDILYRDGFSNIGDISVDPDSVTVRGARSILERIDRWRTKPIVMRDVREPVQTTVALSDTLAKLLTLSEQYVAVRLDVQPIAEQTFSGLRVLIEGVPANREVMLIPPRIDLVVRGGINQLADIDATEFTARVHYRDLLADTSGTIVPQIEGPEDVRIVNRNPARFQYVIRRLQ